MLKTKFIITALILFLGAVFTRPVYADQHDRLLEEMCQPDKGVFERISKALENIDIRRTISNSMVTMFTDSMFMVSTGGSSGQVFKCIDYMNNDLGLNLIPDMPASCSLEETEKVFCESLINSYTDSVDRTAAFNTPQQAGGSLAMIGYALDDVTNEPLPMNLAYYAGRQMEKVPFANRAFAQFDPSSAANYSGPVLILDVTFTLWKIVRDVSYGLIALIMIVTGIMIMTRKRINPQTMVTVQYAIPRIIIALVLITFSYAIGATLASLGWVLRGSAEAVVYSLAGITDTDIHTIIGFGLVPLLLPAIILAIVGTGGAGVALLIIGAVGLVVSLILYILIQIKIMIIYLRIIVKTISAPFTFAISAVPGNDDKIVNWFKEIGVAVLSMLGMRAVLSATHLVIAILVLNSIQDIFSGSAVGGIGEFIVVAALAPMIVPFILAYGYYQAWQLPKKLETALLGSKKPTK